MEFVVGLAIAAVVVLYWLRGGLLAATFLQLGYLAIGGALALDGSPGSFAIVCAVIWAPCAWRSLHRREAAKIKAERDAVADGWRRYFEQNGIAAAGFAAPLRQPGPAAAGSPPSGCA